MLVLHFWQLFKAEMLSMEPWAAAKKKLPSSVAVPSAPVRIPSQRPLAPCVASVTSIANDKGDNEMILRTDLLTFALKPRKTPRKPQLGDHLIKHLIKGLCDQSSPQMRSVKSHNTSGREDLRLTN